MESSRNAYVLTDDAVRDLAAIEDCILSYSNDSYVEAVEDSFFEAFELLKKTAFQHPVYIFEALTPSLHEYRSVNVYHYKVFYYIRDDAVVIYRICHLASDFTRFAW